MGFLRELEELRSETPRLYNINVGCENSQYCTHADKDKNCYLVFAINFSEDCIYGGVVIDSRDCVDCAYCEKAELCYDCTDVMQSYNCNFCQEVKNCTDCYFCYNCVGCKNCFACAGLRQKEYCIYNEYVGKEKYQEFMKNFSFRNETQVAEAVRKMRELDLKTPRKYMHEIDIENCCGDYILNCKNCFACYDVHGSEDCMYMTDCWRTQDSCDIVFSDGSELCYECFSIGIGTYNCNFCNYIRSSSNLEYCELCFNCKDCFGCIGLQSKQYCILNQQYSRDEYVKKVAEIKVRMGSDGTYGTHLSTTYKWEDTAAAA